jgi:DNA-binding GntR family transcriptional regulator
MAKTNTPAKREPRYRGIADVLREPIARGRYPVGA